MKIMAIDYGKSRVGIAITDPLGIIAQPFLTIPVKSKGKLIKRLKFLIRENNIAFVLIGNPISNKGQATPMSKEVTEFARRLKKAINIEVKLWDERYTSQYAAAILKETGAKRVLEKIDQVAASIMLEEYLKSSMVNLT